MSKSAFATHTIAGAALLCAGLPALASSETSSGGAMVSTPRASINCPGITNVPMTADAEQSLPMRTVATLGCKEPVVVLADTEGYTVHIRRSDGQEGYVARMYLTIGGSDASPAVIQAPPTALPANSIVRWQSSAPGCDQFMAKGYNVESVTANGITVQVSLQDSGWKLRATIAISNAAGDAIDVIPAMITLDELAPGLKSLQAVDPAKLSGVVNHQVLLTQANAQPPASAHFAEVHVNNVSYRASTPNYFTERTVPTTSSSNSASAYAGSELAALALKHNKLAPGQKTTGVVWFQRDANARELSLRVPVGDLVFDFPLTFSQKK